jgi:hypothetical protein
MSVSLLTSPFHRLGALGGHSRRVVPGAGHKAPVRSNLPEAGQPPSRRRSSALSWPNTTSPATAASLACRTGAAAFHHRLEKRLHTEAEPETQSPPHRCRARAAGTSIASSHHAVSSSGCRISSPLSLSSAAFLFCHRSSLATGTAPAPPAPSEASLRRRPPPVSSTVAAFLLCGLGSLPLFSLRASARAP